MRSLSVVVIVSVVRWRSLRLRMSLKFFVRNSLLRRWMLSWVVGSVFVLRELSRSRVVRVLRS